MDGAFAEVHAARAEVADDVARAKLRERPFEPWIRLHRPDGERLGDLALALGKGARHRRRHVERDGAINPAAPALERVGGQRPPAAGRVGVRGGPVDADAGAPEAAQGAREDCGIDLRLPGRGRLVSSGESTPCKAASALKVRPGPTSSSTRARLFQELREGRREAHRPAEVPRPVVGSVASVRGDPRAREVRHDTVSGGPAAAPRRHLGGKASRTGPSSPSGRRARCAGGGPGCPQPASRRFERVDRVRRARRRRTTPAR